MFKFPRGPHTLYVTDTSAHGETCKAISYRRRNQCCCITRAELCLRANPQQFNVFILPVILTEVVCFQETPVILLTLTETPMM